MINCLFLTFNYYSIPIKIKLKKTNKNNLKITFDLF